MKSEEYWRRLEEARRILKLPLQTTRREIVEQYRRLVKTLHPDKGGSEEELKKVNQAYEFLMEYCDRYLIELKPSSKLIQDPENWWFEHFGNDPIWGKKV